MSVYGEIVEFIPYLQELLDSLEMYAFYSLLVYIFYTVFKKEEEDALEAACGASSDVCLATSWPASGGSLPETDFVRGTYMRYLPSVKSACSLNVQAHKKMTVMFHV